MLRPTIDIGGEINLRPGVNIKSLGTLGGIISAILPNIFVIAGLIAFFLMVGAGLMFIISAGQQNPEGAANAKQTFTYSLIGFLIIFGSYWIIQIIQIVTGIDILGGGGL